MAENILICGIDEAGRGPLAGPVCSAAVILGNNFNGNFLNDSKKLSAAKRDGLRQMITDNAVAWGLGWADQKEIDNINILQAALLSMRRAFEEMMKKLEKECSLPPGAEISVIVDGNKLPGLSVPCKAMVKADAQIPEVMAASILAKTARDDYMEEMAKLYPQYGYEKHKGYGTKAHMEAIRKHGPSPIQRMSFRYK